MATRKLNTYQKFVKAKMSKYIKKYGSNAKAMKQIGKEWREKTGKPKAVKSKVGKSKAKKKIPTVTKKEAKEIAAILGKRGGKAHAKKEKAKKRSLWSW